MTLVVVLFLDFEAKQLGAILVRGGGQQSLGLDARLARRVQPQQVERDVAHQRQVVRDMARSAAGVVVAELNVQAPGVRQLIT